MLRRFTQGLGTVVYIAIAFVLYRLNRADSIPIVASGLLLLVLASMPGVLWLRGLVGGLPVFPVFALSYSWTFALPLLLESPRVSSFGADDCVYLSLVVGGSLLLGTLAWLWLGHMPRRLSERMRMLDSVRGEWALIVSLGVQDALTTAQRAGWLSLPPGYDSLLNGVLLGLGAIAAFVLPYLAARGALTAPVRRLVWGLLVWNVLASLVTLLMIGALSTLALAAIGYSLAKRRIPVLALAVLFGGAALFHAGKTSMREHYWSSPGAVEPLKPWQYPGFFLEWLGSGADVVRGADGPAESRADVEPFTERSSLAHLFLLAHGAEARGLPRLRGTTYAVIPGLLVPRLLMPDKPRSHEGTYLLNIYYGLQTRADTYTTTIGWGLTNEAYANFGSAGVLALLALLGALSGLLARWTRGAPPLSIRFLFAGLCLGYAFQAEFTAGVLVSALFQSSVGLVALGLVAARVAPADAHGESASP